MAYNHSDPFVRDECLQFTMRPYDELLAVGEYCLDNVGDSLAKCLDHLLWPLKRVVYGGDGRTC